MRVFAHRGYSGKYPENTMLAFREAEKVGTDGIELDVQLSRDGQIVIIHDETLNRTTNGGGVIADTTWAYISTLRLKNGCDITTKHKVPTLEDALLLAKGRVMLNLDKADRYFDEIYPLLQQTGTTKQVIMKGGRRAEAVLKEFGQYLSEVVYMPIVNLDEDGAEERIEAFVKKLQPAAFELIYAQADNPLPLKIGKTLQGRSLIWYNTLWDTLCGGHDDDAALHDMSNGYDYVIDQLGARIIQTDRPQFLLNYLRGRGLHD